MPLQNQKYFQFLFPKFMFLSFIVLKKSSKKNNLLFLFSYPSLQNSKTSKRVHICLWVNKVSAVICHDRLNITEK